MRVLVTRPEPEASLSAERLVRLGHQPIVDPVLVAEPTGIALPDPTEIAAIALTSRAAVRALAAAPAIARLRGKPVFTVGDATAEAARAEGFTAVRSAHGTWSDLADLLVGNIDPTRPGRVLYATAPERSGDLEGVLSAAGLAVELREVYRMVPSAGLAPATVDAASRGAIDAVLLFSRRTAEVFVSHLTDTANSADWLAIPVHAISASVAARATGAGFRSVRVASEPTAESLFATLR